VACARREGGGRTGLQTRWGQNRRKTTSNVARLKNGPHILIGRGEGESYTIMVGVDSEGGDVGWGDGWVTERVCLVGKYGAVDGGSTYIYRLVGKLVDFKDIVYFELDSKTVVDDISRPILCRKSRENCEDVEVDKAAAGLWRNLAPSSSYSIIWPQLK
jgi:hypothetical protein